MKMKSKVPHTCVVVFFQKSCNIEIDSVHKKEPVRPTAARAAVARATRGRCIDSNTNVMSGEVKSKYRRRGQVADTFASVTIQIQWPAAPEP